MKLPGSISTAFIGGVAFPLFVQIPVVGVFPLLLLPFLPSRYTMTGDHVNVSFVSLSLVSLEAWAVYALLGSLIGLFIWLLVSGRDRIIASLKKD